MFNLESFTPEKSQIVTKINGKHVEQRIKYINKKGTFRRTEQCKDCKFCGKVQLGLGFAFDISCDRDEGFWRMSVGKTDKPCKYFQPKE